MPKYSKGKAVLASLLVGAMTVAYIPAVSAAAASSVSASVGAQQILLISTPLTDFSLWANAFPEQQENRGLGNQMRFSHDRTIVQTGEGVYEYTDGKGDVHTFRYSEERGGLYNEQGDKLIDYGEGTYWIRAASKDDIYFLDGRLAYIYYSNQDPMTFVVPKIWVDYNEQGFISAVRYTDPYAKEIARMEMTYSTLENGMTVCTRVDTSIGQAIELLYDGAGNLVGTR